MRGAFLLAASAAAFSVSIPHAAKAQTAPVSAPHAWWFVDELNDAPDRKLFFVDRNSLTRHGDDASVRVAAVFEQPQDGIKGFEATYEFHCARRQQRRHDAVFTQPDGSLQRWLGAPDTWQAVAAGSESETVLDATCGGTFPTEAHAIALAPAAEAERLFRRAPQLASAPAGHRLVPRDELICRLRHGETAAQVSAHPDPTPAACRAPMQTAGRAPASGGRTSSSGAQSYARLLDNIVQADSQDWSFNRYMPGSMQIVDVRTDARGNITMLKGIYRFDPSGRFSQRFAGTLLDPRLFASVAPPSQNAGQGWVEAYFVNGRLRCLQYHDRDSCITSTRDYYQQINQAEHDHLEYCNISRNC